MGFFLYTLPINVSVHLFLLLLLLNIFLFVAWWFLQQRNIAIPLWKKNSIYLYIYLFICLFNENKSDNIDVIPILLEIDRQLSKNVPPNGKWFYWNKFIKLFRDGYKFWHNLCREDNHEFSACFDDYSPPSTLLEMSLRKLFYYEKIN